MMVAAAPRIGDGAAGVPRVRPRRGAGRAQRALRPRLPQGGVRARTASRWPAGGLGRHRRPGPPAAHPRRGAQLQAGHPRALLPRHHLPHATARWTTPGPPSTSCTACSSGSGPLGITSLEELTGLTRQVDPERLRKRHLADAVPRGPGVYLFRGPRDEPLYVGTSNDLRSRVRSYFSSGEQRSRITEMVALSQRVDAIPCAHDLEAAVRELRLIAEHKPRYNRRSRFPERALWVRLTEEPFPRLSVVRRVRPGAGVFLGPFPDRRAADAAVAAVHESLPLRQCTDPDLRRASSAAACALAGMGRCGAPCTGAQSVDEYAAIAAVFRAAVDHDPRALVAPLLRPGRPAGRRGALRGRRGAARPGRRPGPGRAPPPAAGVAGRRPRAGPRPARRRRRLAPVRRPPRPAGGRRRRPARAPRSARRWPACWRPPRPCPARTTSWPPRSTRPSWCCAGWRSRAPGWSS